MENLVPIGNFSRICRLSIKALRHYDELGLLTPAVIDPSSGYRYYRLGQANRAEAIRVLRSLDMPLEEIREALATDDPEVVAKVLDRHRGRLEEQLERRQRALAFLERLIARKEGVMPYEVQVKEVPTLQVAAVRKHTSLATIGQDIGQSFGAIMMALGGAGSAPVGPPFIVFHDVIDEETGGDVEICFPVLKPFEGSGDVYGAVIGGGPVAWTVHRGPYDEVALAYHTLSEWIQGHGHEMAGPPREVYLTNPTEVADPAENVTEIDWPIR